MGKHDHPHVEASGASLAKAAQTALEGAGEAWTDMRAEIFDAVAAIGKPASAYEIADIVSQKRGKRVAPNSVYRILDLRSEEHTSELQSLMRNSYAVFCLKKKKK